MFFSLFFIINLKIKENDIQMFSRFQKDNCLRHVIILRYKNNIENRLKEPINNFKIANNGVDGCVIVSFSAPPH